MPNDVVMLDTQDLATFLAEEIVHYRQLVDLGARERNAILGRDPSELNEIVHEKERIVARIGRIEVKRQNWVRDWAKSHQSTHPTPSLLELMQGMSEEESHEVPRLRDELLHVMRDLAELNHSNGMLVQSALHLVTRSIDAFSRIAGTNEHYEPSGARARNSRTAVMDWSA